MKPVITLLGIILVIVGVVFLGYQGITYTTREKVVEIGDLQLTADKEKTVRFSPYLGGAALAAGVVLLLIGRRSGPQ